MNRAEFTNAKRIVIKIGSSLLTAGGKGLDKSAIAAWVEQIISLKQQGKEVILVSSGAVAEGVSRLGFKQRPKLTHELQAAAAVGQMGLIGFFENNFQQQGFHAAQVLLTQHDLNDEELQLNVRETLLALLNLSAIPIINENDTVATQQFCFGDNDSLAALVVNLVQADLLIILTDQQGLFDADPSLNSKANLIEHAYVNDDLLDKVAGESQSGLGRGGMYTKVRAARLASKSGATTIIVLGKFDAVITEVIKGKNLGTCLTPHFAN